MQIIPKESSKFSSHIDPNFVCPGLIYDIRLGRDEGDDKLNLVNFPIGERETVTTIVPDSKIPIVKNVFTTDKELYEYRVNILAGLLGVTIAAICILSYLYFNK